MSWKFYLNNIEIEEPTGWDAIALKIKREQGGTQFEFTDNLTFVDDAADILRAFYGVSGVDAECLFKVDYCGSLFAEYLVNFTNYSDLNNEITVNIEQTGFLQRFKNRIELPVELETNTSLDGDSIDGDLSKIVQLHSKTIFKKNIWAYSTDFNEIEIDGGGLGPSQLPQIITIFNMPFVNISDELKKALDINEYFQLYPNQNLFPLSPLVPEVNAIFKIAEKGANLRMKGRLKLRISCDYAHECDINVRLFSQLAGVFTRGVDAPVQYGYFGNNQTGVTGPFVYDIDVSFDDPFPVAENGLIFLVAEVDIRENLNSVLQGSVKFKIECLPETKVEISQETIENDSDNKVILLHEAFDKLVQIYTGRKNAFYSEFLGRTDIGYSQTGCLANIAITNGLNIRNAINVNTGIKHTIVTSFKDLYESVDCLIPLGWVTEKIGNIERIRIEPLEYFYQNTAILKFSNVSNIKTSPAVDIIANEIQAGYDKWNLNFSISNGLDEFLSKRNYYIPIINAKKTNYKNLQIHSKWLYH